MGQCDSLCTSNPTITSLSQQDFVFIQNPNGAVFRSLLNPYQSTYKSQVSFEGQPPNKYDQQMIDKGLQHKCIGALLMRDPITQKQGYGTAFLVAPDIAITAAHNIFNRRTDCKTPLEERGSRFYDNIRFYFGINGSNKKEKCYRALVKYDQPVAFIPLQYLQGNKGQGQHDYAFVKLERKVQNHGYLKLHISFKEEEQSQVCLCGYPADRAIKNYNYEIEGMHFNAWQYYRIDPDKVIIDSHMREKRRILHRLSSYPGQSGSPMIQLSHKTKAVVGIHVGGRDMIDETQNTNFARLINLGLVFNLLTWQYYNDCSKFQFTQTTEDIVLNLDTELEIDLQSLKDYMKNVSFSEEASKAQKAVHYACSCILRSGQKLPQSLRERLSNELQKVKESLLFLIPEPKIASQSSLPSLKNASSLKSKMKESEIQYERSHFSEPNIPARPVIRPEPEAHRLVALDLNTPAKEGKSNQGQREQFKTIEKLQGLKGLQNYNNRLLIYCQNLKTIDLNGAKIGLEGCRYLSRGQWHLLNHLDLSQNQIDQDSCFEISKSQHWQRLKILILSSNEISDQGCEYLSRGKWPELQVLNLNSNDVKVKGCKAIDRSCWKKLKWLYLCHNHILALPVTVESWFTVLKPQVCLE